MGHPSVLYELNIDVGSHRWGVSCPVNKKLIGPVEYGWNRYQIDPHSMTFGGGLLAGSPLPGTRRMVFTGYSPQWEGFYASSLGGAMYVFHRAGLNYVWLRGRSEQDLVLKIKLENGNYSVDFDPIDTEKIWNRYVDKNGREWKGFYALQRAVFEKYKSHFTNDWFRILATGPAAKSTREGAIGSNHIKKGELSSIDDWAGRGGMGSLLLQQHGVAAIIFGGDWEDPELKEAREMDEFFLQKFGKRAITSDLALTQKYRYMPQFETGGTFGVNMYTADDKLFSFNYSSIYTNADERLEQHKNYILDHYLEQFNQEIIQNKNFDHCGEPCAVACKKYHKEFKKDYEPYEALGPNCGIFDQRAAETLNKWIDSAGWDAIQAGGTISWLMELITEGLIPPEDFGLPSELPPFKFSSNKDNSSMIQASQKNAEYAIAIANMVLFSDVGKPFRKGIRAAAKWLDKKYDIHSIDRAVYNSHGEEGCMVPNQYWVPGMFAPMPLMGKYFSYYGVEFYPPYELGKKNVERFVYELYSENSGACRFHRKWVEDIIDDIILKHFNLDIDFWQMNFNLARSIHDFQSDTSVFWESERVIDIIHGYLEKWQQDGLENPELEKWLDKFRHDKFSAAKEYWQLMKDGMSDAFSQGMLEPAKDPK